MTSTTAHWLGLAVYVAIVIGVGFWFMVKRKADDHGNMEFWMAGRSFSGWRLGMSLTAGWLMLGWIGFGMSQIYMYGVTGLWILPIPWFILCILIILIVPWVRRVGAISLPQAIEKRFGVSARTLLAIFSFFVFLAWTQAELFMAGSLMSPFLGISPTLCMVILVIPIAIYTTLGGFRAIVMTDVIQFLIMAVFMVILAFTAVQAASTATDGNIMDAISKSSPPWLPEGESVWSLSALGWLFPLILLIGYLPGWLIEQDLILRIQAASSTKEATKGALLGLVFITIFVLVLPTIAAFSCLVAYPPVEGAGPEAIGGDAMGMISALIARLPLFGSVFMLIGLVACQMSTVDTFTNVSAMPLSYDLIEPLICKKKLSDRSRVVLARVVSLVVVFIALGMALVSSSLGDVYYISSGILSASIAVPVLFLFWKRTTLPAVLTSSVAGFAGTVGMYWFEYKNPDAATLLPPLLQPSFGYNYLVVGVLASVVVIVLVSLVTKRPEQAKLDSVEEKPIDDLDVFTRSVES